MNVMRLCKMIIEETENGGFVEIKKSGWKDYYSVVSNGLVKESFKEKHLYKVIAYLKYFNEDFITKTEFKYTFRKNKF